MQYTVTTGKPPYQRYKATLMPHLLSIDSKKIGITRQDKSAWKKLACSERERLKKRYNSASADDLWQDMAFKRRCGVSKSNAFLDHGPRTRFPNNVDKTKNKGDLEIVGAPEDFDPSKLKWIETKHAEYMCKITKYETSLAIAFGKAGIKPSYKTPFVSEGKIYFANLYIPQYRIAIDIIPYGSIFGEDRHNLKKNGLEKINVKYIQLYNHQASDPEFVQNLIKSLAH